jgi:hypothetical protein
MKKTELEDLIVDYATEEITNWKTFTDEPEIPSNTLYQALVQKDHQAKFDADVIKNLRVTAQEYDQNAFEQEAHDNGFAATQQWFNLKHAIGYEGMPVLQQFRVALFELAATQNLVTATSRYRIQLEAEADEFKDLFNHEALAKKLDKKRDAVLEIVEKLATFGEE